MYQCKATNTKSVPSLTMFCEKNEVQISLREIQKYKQREASQEHRDKIKKQRSEKIKTETFFNNICKLFPEQEWKMTFFNQNDKPLIGERKEKNRIASLNSRNRAKALDAELDRRLEVLEQALQPRFRPRFDFDFPEDDECEA